MPATLPIPICHAVATARFLWPIMFIENQQMSTGNMQITPMVYKTKPANSASRLLWIVNRIRLPGMANTRPVTTKA